MTNPIRQSEPRPLTERGRPHGKISSWVLVAAVIAAFVSGGVALIAQAWWLFWLGAAVVALSIPAGRLIRIMDDTVAWTHPLPGRYDGNITLEATRRQHERKRQRDDERS